MGLPVPLVSGLQTSQNLGEQLLKFFGTGYIGGNLSVNSIGQVVPDDEITTKGVVREKVDEGDSIRLVLDVWCENQHGEKVIVGSASGLVH